MFVFTALLFADKSGRECEIRFPTKLFNFIVKEEVFLEVLLVIWMMEEKVYYKLCYFLEEVKVGEVSFDRVIVRGSFTLYSVIVYKSEYNWITMEQ